MNEIKLTPGGKPVKTHICTVCGYTTTIIGNMRRHLSCMKPCNDATLDNPKYLSMRDKYLKKKEQSSSKNTICDKCGKAFKCHTSIYRHKCKAVEPPHDQSDLVNMVREVVQETIKAELKNHPQTINNTNNNNNITINAFGHEDIASILTQTQFLDQCVRRREKGHLELCQQIYRLDNNQNVKPCKVPHLLLCFDGETWVREDKGEVADKMPTQAGNIMQEHFDVHEDRLKCAMSESLYHDVCKYLSSIAQSGNSQDLNAKLKLREDLCAFIEKYWFEIKQRSPHLQGIT